MMIDYNNERIKLKHLLMALGDNKTAHLTIPNNQLFIDSLNNSKLEMYEKELDIQTSVENNNRNVNRKSITLSSITK
eukprot:Pgem_evm1s5509